LKETRVVDETTKQNTITQMFPYLNCLRQYNTELYGKSFCTILPGTMKIPYSG
jgi:hypothetical protein